MNFTGTIADVRTPAEFALGHVPGSINIPLNELPERITEFKQMQQPLLICCASGIRSAQATLILNQNGIPCNNAGSWMNIQF